jgi:DNA polymerase-3 subunit epsilon
MIADLIQLERPLVTIDFETTGLYPKVDRICQIGLLKLYPDGELTEWETLIDPVIPIPPAVSEIHGIRDADVKDAPDFADIAAILHKGLENCDLAGYNAKAFDVGFLVEEFARVNIRYVPPRIVDVFLIYKKYSPRNLTQAVKHYLNEDHSGAHTALADARAALRVLRAQLEHHTDLPRTIQGLHDLFGRNPNNVDADGKFVWNNGIVIFTFGKYKGLPLNTCKDYEYFRFIANANFSDEVKKIVLNAMNGKYPTR